MKTDLKRKTYVMVFKGWTYQGRFLSFRQLHDRIEIGLLRSQAVKCAPCTITVEWEKTK